MIKVLFVCHGNICRSPMAEFVFKDMVKKRGLENEFHIESRATHTDEIWNGQGSPVYPPAREKLNEVGISCKGKHAQLLAKSDYRDYDYIIGMDSENRRWMPRILGGDQKRKYHYFWILRIILEVLLIHGILEILKQPIAMLLKVVQRFWNT